MIPFPSSGEPPAPRTPHLFLLARPTVEERRQAAARVREMDVPVVAQYGQVAVEVSATRAEAERIWETGQFSTRLSRTASTDHLERLGPEQRVVVEQWNTRFTEPYRALSRDRTHRGKSWGSGGGLEAPGPHTAIDPEDFLERMRRFEVPRPEEPDAGEGGPGRAPRGAAFARHERELAARYRDPRLAYHLVRLAWRLGASYHEVMHRLPEALIRELRADLDAEVCLRMTGEISVGIVFVESSRSGGPVFGAAKRKQIRQAILDGHAWLASEHPTGDLSWVYDFQEISIDVPDGTGDPDEAYWRDPAMARVRFDGKTYTGDWTGVDRYRADMRDRNGSAYACVIFVTPYANSWFAYASGGQVTLADKDNWGKWGQSTLDAIAAHETSHLFRSADEYTGEGTPCSGCETTHGCDRIRNGNCGNCAAPHQGCVMNANTRRLCAWTRAHIGWGHLFVEVTTGDETWGGTDDTVWLDIGDQAFELTSPPGHNDRERGNVDGYAFWQPTLKKSDVKRVLVRKSADGFAGGWKLQQVRLWLHGELLCDAGGIDQWLEDDQLWWLGCTFTPPVPLVNQLRVEVSTADEWFAGTDDDVLLAMGGRVWTLDNQGRNDFERGSTDGFELDPGTGLTTAQLTTVQVHKSPDGAFGGWKLKGIRIFVNGSVMFNNQAINTWLEDDHRDWSSRL